MQKHRSFEKSSDLAEATPSRSGTQRQRIVGAMIDSCAEKTYAATTISDIVARARISRTTFYKQFEDKRACFDAAVDNCLEQLQKAAAGSHFVEDAPADALRKAMSAVLEAMTARPGLAQLLTGDAIAVDPMVIERYRKATLPAIEALWARQGSPVETHTDLRVAFGQAQVLILNQIATGNADRLLELLPELVYLAVSPYGGHEEAIRQSRLARESAAGSAVLR
jgi:AcrR family transcriptional regulator